MTRFREYQPQNLFFRLDWLVANLAQMQFAQRNTLDLLPQLANFATDLNPRAAYERHVLGL